MKNKIILHGEVKVTKAVSIPTKAKKLNPSNENYHIIADSETTGNHHIVDCFDGVTIYDNGDTIVMENTQPTQIRCVHTDRHDAIILEPGVWEFGTQKEYDYLTQSLQSVRD
jgi:hypothetical protein